MQSGLAALFVTPSPKKMIYSDRFVDDKPFINKRKPSSTMVAKGALNNGEHTLIPVTEKMNFERFFFKDGQLLHMVKLVGAVRSFRVYTKYLGW
jgi:hypothetical protein